MIKAVFLTFTAIILFSTYACSEENSVWKTYKDHFISEDGRVIDYYQNESSHSEGQSYGMILALIHDDKKLFDKILEWTNNNLNVREDNLLAWKWGKRQNGVWDVVDYNNATDGDVLFAYALLLAQEKWQDETYKTIAIAIIKEIRVKLSHNLQQDSFLLPGYYGFIKADGTVVNPAYFVFPAYNLFSKVDDKQFWEKIYNNSYSILHKNLFSTLKLPADWMILNESNSKVFTERSNNFGYEAIRVPLYISMDNKKNFPEGINKILNMYKKLNYIPLSVDLVNDSFSLKSAPAGFYAVFALAAKSIGDLGLSEKLFAKSREKLIDEKNDYYSYTLYLISKGTIK